jgi:hypothetical protein
MKYLYYLSAIGEPNYNKKIEILFHNIDYICNQLKCKIDIILNVYDTNPQLNKLLDNHENINKFFIHTKKGVLVELWKSNPFNQFIKNYDYIFFCYDDVEIETLYISEMIQTMNT